MRLFVALALPDAVARSLMLLQGGVPGARWQAREQLHLTLRFIGEVDGRSAAMLDDALAAIRAPAFSLQCHGVGEFGVGGKGRSQALWAGVRANDMLDHLQRKVDNAIRRVGQTHDAHKFTPHVTLARLRHSDTEKVVDWLRYNALHTGDEFAVDAFHLWSSSPTSDGSRYRIEQSYELEMYDGEAGDGETDD